MNYQPTRDKLAQAAALLQQVFDENGDLHVVCYDKECHQHINVVQNLLHKNEKRCHHERFETIKPWALDQSQKPRADAYYDGTQSNPAHD